MLKSMLSSDVFVNLLNVKKSNNNINGVKQTINMIYLSKIQFIYNKSNFR